MKTIFITGTDTDVGKTFVSSLLLRAFNAAGLKTFAIKPIASGCQYDENGKLKNNDALLLQQHASIKKPYSAVNPIAFLDPIAPHLAAHKEKIALSKSHVKSVILSSIQKEADVNLIEGVGGWSVPLNNETLFSDVIAELHLPVILVVGIKLGCLNHALLTYKNIVAMGAPFVGWIANCLAPDTLCIEENIDTLRQWIKAPCLGVVPYRGESLLCLNIQEIQTLLDISKVH